MMDKLMAYICIAIIALCFFGILFTIFDFSTKIPKRYDIQSADISDKYSVRK